MKTSLQELQVLRSYWIRTGHKNVPHPSCCCGHESNGCNHYTDKGIVKYCQIHVGYYYTLLHLLMRIFLFLRWRAPAGLLQRKYHAKDREL
jgi:hypothetical protein